MPEEVEGASTTVKQQGVFDVDGVLDEISSWMKGHLYSYFESKLRYSPGSRSVAIEGDRKLDDYAKFALEVSVEADDLKKVDVVTDQTKQERDQGIITIKIKGKLILDHVKRYDDDKWKGVRAFLHRTFLKGRVGAYADELDADVFALTSKVREALEMSV